MRVSATAAARAFSEMLNRVAGGEEIEIVRSGAAVAVLRPAKPVQVDAHRLREALLAAPTVDAAFAEDVMTLRESGR